MKYTSKHGGTGSRMTGANKVTAPADKAKQTQGLKLTGRITLRQFQFLVNRNYDAAVVMHWSKHRASKEIEKILKR